MSRLLSVALLGLLGFGQAHADAEDEMKGFIVDETISHIGHDFYRYFSERLRDSTPLDFNLVVRERPSARWGSLVWVENRQRVVHREFLPPNTAELKPVAYAAANRVAEAVVRQRLEMLLQDTTDIDKDEL